MINKANDGTGNIIERDIWQTPQKLWDELNKQYGFNMDCCASDDNKKCELFFDNFEESIKFQLDGHCCWMNPPFSKSYKMFSHFFKVVNKGVAIYRCDNMETKIWQDVIFKYASWIFIPKRRIKYEGIKGTGSRFPSALVGFNVNIPKLNNGTILIIKLNK